MLGERTPGGSMPPAGPHTHTHKNPLLRRTTARKRHGHKETQNRQTGADAEQKSSNSKTWQLGSRPAVARREAQRQELDVVCCHTCVLSATNQTRTSSQHLCGGLLRVLPLCPHRLGRADGCADVFFVLSTTAPPRRRTEHRGQEDGRAAGGFVPSCSCDSSCCLVVLLVVALVALVCSCCCSCHSCLFLLRLVFLLFLLLLLLLLSLLVLFVVFVLFLFNVCCTVGMLRMLYDVVQEFFF